MAELLFSGFDEDHSLLLMSYNVENLFDSVDDGTEYPEFDPQYGRWGIGEYYAKLKAVAGVIRRANEGRGPDLIAFQEVEKEEVLSTLQKEFLLDLGYSFVSNENDFQKTESGSIVTNLRLVY